MNKSTKLLTTVLMLSALNQSVSANPILYTLAACFFTGVNKQAQDNLPLVKKAEDYTYNTTIDGAKVIAGGIYDWATDAYEAAEMKTRILMNKDDAFLSEESQDVDFSYENAVYNRNNGKVLTDKDKTFYNHFADKLNGLTYGVFRDPSVRLENYLLVTINSKNPVVQTDENGTDVFYDAEEPKTPTPSTIKPNDSTFSSNSGSYLTRFLPSFSLF